MPEQETERREPKFAEVESAEVKIPQPGEMLDAVVTKLGMTTALEVYTMEKLEGSDPNQPVLLVFFESSENGIKGNTSLPYYKVPTPKTKIASFVRHYGQLKVGTKIRIERNDRGYWGIAL